MGTKERTNKAMKIGITEYGDAGVDFRWEDRLGEVDGAVLITKNLNPVFQSKVLEHAKTKPIIVHCTCTGWGGTVMEPHVPTYKQQLDWLCNFIKSGFPAERIVLRIDPIFPTRNGLNNVLCMMNYMHTLDIPADKLRYRISVVDEYPHVRERYKKLGFAPMYDGNFYPSAEQLALVGKTLSTLPYKFATCAEDKLAAMFPNTFEIKGCISSDDLALMGLKPDDSFTENPQHRTGCHCLSCKYELLNKPRKKCPHNCLYCFWKD